MTWIIHELQLTLQGNTLLMLSTRRLFSKYALNTSTLQPYIWHTWHLYTGNRPMSVAKAVLLKSLLRRGTCTNGISIVPFLATSGMHFVLPPCVHLHTVIVLLSSKLAECLQDTALTPLPLSGDAFACCFSQPYVPLHQFPLVHFPILLHCWSQFYSILFSF